MKHLGDITKINGAEIEPVDVITFGSPCQDLSIAGLRKGLAGSRSGLYVQAVRVIREMLDATNREYPKFVVFENVPGMLSSNKGKDFVAALDMMSELRFIPDPNIHDAQYCGVPQRRRRIGIAWANTDAILKKRTILSDSIMLQCLSEILLIDLTEALQVFGIEPKGQQYRAKWLSEDGRRRRIELFSLQKENALQMWQQRLDEMQATYQNAQDCSASTVGEVQMDFFTLMDVGTSTDAKTEGGSISIGKLLSRQSDEDSNQLSGYTTSTWTKEIMPSKICTCFQALLDILALTGAYINSAARTNSDVKSYFEWVLYILMLTKEYINARQANGASVAKLVGDDLLRDWNIRLQACEDTLVADFGGGAAPEILFEQQGVSWDPAESGAAGEGSAEAAEGGFNPAVARSLTARADGSPCADRGPNIVCSPHQGGCDGGGKGALVQRERSGTLGTGNDQTIFFCLATQQGGAELRTDDCAPTLTAAAGMSGNNQPVVAIPINDKATRWQGGGESRNHDGSGNGLGIGKEGDPSPTLTAGDRHGVMCMTPWDAQSQRVYDGNGVSPTLSSRENSGLNREAVLCAGFKLGNSEQARSIGYQEELSPTLNAECGGNKPAVVAPAVALDMTHACDVIRECGEQVPALQARMGTGGNQVPLTFQMQGFGDYRSREVASSCKQRDFKDSTDLVCAVDCRNFREGGEVNGTLQAKESGGQSLNLNNTVRQNMVVRRLTPLECERLQGFPEYMEMDVEKMTKDEYIAVNIATGQIVVDCENGEIYTTKGPGGVRLKEPKKLDGSNVNGYKVVSIRNGQTKMQCRVHRIVWIARNGVIPEGYVVDHINNDKTDNRICNLQILTAEENSHKAWRDGRYLMGDDNPSTKLPVSKRKEIVELYKSGEYTMRQLANDFGISKSRIHQIVKTSGWTDIGDWTDSKGKKHKAADSPRYKALGNSIALPFWQWMFGRIAKYLPENATLGSLFDGIGGFPLTWQRIHGEGSARWSSEIEEFPMAVTRLHFGTE